MAQSSSQCWLWVACALLAAVTFIGCQVLSFFSMGTSNVIFTSSTGNISDQYSTEITPASWTFSIWGVIYIFQALWIIHAIVSIFRKGNGGPLYKNPEIVSVLFLAVFSINMCLNVTWLIVFDRLLFEVSLVVLILISVTLYIILIDYHRRINRNVKVMAKEHKVDLVLFRIFLQNGVSIYATWCTIATLLNLTFVLLFTANLTQQTACIIALSVLTAELMIFVVMDWLVLERYLRYTFTTYLTVIWALTGSMAANWDPAKPHSIMTLVLLAITVVMFIGKIIHTIVRSKRNPLYLEDIQPTNKKDIALEA